MIFNIMNKILKKPKKNPNKQKTQRFFPIRRLFKLVSTTRQKKKKIRYFMTWHMYQQTPRVTFHHVFCSYNHLNHKIFMTWETSRRKMYIKVCIHMNKHIG